MRCEDNLQNVSVFGNPNSGTRSFDIHIYKNYIITYSRLSLVLSTCMHALCL